MRILHIAAFPPDHLGGVEIFCKNLTQKLREYNIHSEILTTNLTEKKTKVELYYNIKIIKQRPYFWIWNLNPLTSVFSFILKNYKKYDIIHAHAYVFISTLQAILLKKIFRLKIPLILHLHGTGEVENISSLGFSMKLLIMFKKILFDRIFGFFFIDVPDALISVSKKDIQSIHKIFRTKRKNIFFIPNGIDTEKFFPNNYNPKYITFIGQLSHLKGIDIFLDVCKRIWTQRKNIQFLIIGDGLLKDLVISAQKEIPITYYPSVKHFKIPDFLNQTAILLLTSRADGLPTVLLEAASCGVPIIASNVGGVSEVVHHGKNGFLFNINELEAVFRYIDQILDKHLYNAFLEYNQNFIKKNYSWDVIIKKIIRVYNKIAENKKSPLIK